jgi:hypothetical protein
MSYRVTVLGVALAALAVIPAARADGTIRIEPRAVYGATVTIEEGVRVYRPLPPERTVIVNPGGATPLNLGISETRVFENKTSYSRSVNEHRYSGRGFLGYRPCIPAVGGRC